MRVAGYALAEWREWLSSKSHVGTLIAMAVLSFAASFKWMGPLSVSALLPAAALGLGWASGNRYKPGSRHWKILLGSNTTASHAASGKALECLAEACLQLLVLSPPVVLVLALWQRSLSSTLLLGLSFIAAFCLCSALGFVSCLFAGRKDNYASLALLCAWLVPTLFLPGARFMSPFHQVWTSMGGHPAAMAADFAGIAIEAAVAAALFSAAPRAIGFARRRDASV